MKATLEFDMDLPEDVGAHYRCTVSLKMAFVINEMDNHLRNLMKYHEMSEIEYERVEKIREFLRECMNENGIDLDAIMA